MHKRLSSVSVPLFCVLVFNGVLAAEVNSLEEREGAKTNAEQPRVELTPDDPMGISSEAIGRRESDSFKIMDEVLSDSRSRPLATPATYSPIDQPTVRFRLPMLSNYWWSVSQYCDLDTGAAVLDYDCLGAVITDGHDGIDYALRDFVDQDEGRFVVAAAPGTVWYTDDGNPDRNTQGGGSPNYVILEHSDGTRTQYIHFRKWSVLVATGQEVLEGQPLGLIGSSGASNGPHLHFAVREAGSSLEPHSGSCNLGDPLWHNQPDHVMDEPIELFHAGMTTEDPIPTGSYKFRPPDVFHIKRESGGTTHYFWARMRYAHAGDELRMVYRDPGGSVFIDETFTFSTWSARPWARWTSALPGSGGSNGTWTIEFQINGEVVATKQFEYDNVAYQDPVGVGRTVPVPHGTSGGELHGSDADSGIAEYRIVTPPSHGRVTLTGPRQKYFFYVPESGFQGLDTFTFEVEDGQGQISAPATMTMDTSPVVANALRSEGEDDHVSVPDNGSLNLTEALTLEAWVKRGTGSAYFDGLFDRRYLGSNTTGFSFKISPDSTLRLQLGDGSTTVFADGTTPIPMHRWTHVAATWDGEYARVYVNGVQDGTPVAFTGPPSYPGAGSTLLGRTYSGHSFRGEIDEMRIWSAARSVSQLQDGMPCGLYQGAPPGELRGWWRLDGNGLDSSSYGNDGVLVAPAVFVATDGVAPLSCSGLDTDADTVEDNVDNCPLTPNLDQSDSDGDGRGDACDLCPAVFARREADYDRDGVSDACDGCPFLADSEQVDADSDGTGDLCDSDSTDDTVGVPSGDIELSLNHDGGTGTTTVDWTAEPLASSYEVYRGDLVEIRAAHYGTCRNSSDSNTSDTTFDDSESPDVGGVFGYLVIGAGQAGDRGRAGLGSKGSERDLRAKDCI